MGKLVAIETFERFQLLQNDNQIQDTSLIFILDTGQFYTHGILFNSVSYGAINNDTVTLNVGGTSKTLSLASHTHSNYYAKNANLDIDDYKIVSGSAPLLYYEDDVVKVGSTSTPTYLHGTLKAIRGDNTYTILDTGNTSIENKTISGVSMSNVATFKYGNSNFQLDYVKRENTIIALDTLASYTNMGTTNENSKFYGFMTMYTDGRAIDPKFAQIRINIDDNILEFRSSSNRNWTGLLQGGAYKNITINGTTYSLVTKSNSLPTLYIPTSLGSGGQCLSVADDGGSLVWRTVTIPEIVANSTTQNGVVLKGQGNPNKVWMTDADGAPNWRDLNVNSILAAATTTTLGGIKIQSINANAVTPNTDAESSGRYYGVRIDANELAYVNVPWQDTWIAWAGATTTADGTSGYMPGATIADRLKYLRGDGTWQELNNYSLPIASSTTLGGIKTGAAVTDVSDLIAVHIKDGVIYYKDTTYTFYNLLFHDGTNVVDTYKPTTTPSKTLKAGSNVSISAASNVITIASADTWKANSASSEGYVASGSGQASKVWMTDANGNPSWQNANNHTHSYLPLSGGRISKDLGYNLTDWVTGQHNGPFEVGRSSNTMCITIGVTDDNYGYIQTKGANITTPGNLVLLPGGGNLYLGNTSTTFITSGNISSQSVNYATSATNLNSSQSIDSTTKLDAFHEGNILKIAYVDNATGATFGSSDGILLAVGVGSTYGHQIHLDDNNNTMWHRSMVGGGGSWNNWLKVIDSGNIGSQSVNYASSAGNSDTVDSIHATGFLRWKCMENIGGSSPFQNSVDYFNNLSNLNNGGTLVYNHAGGEFTILFTRRNDSTGHGSILKWGYPDKYIRIIRMISGAAQSTDWEKISAGYADSAGNADTVDSQHFTYSNSDNNPTYLWGTNSNGSSILAHRASMSVNYANSAGSATNLVPENTAHYFRDPNSSSWRGGMFWGSAGSESMSFIVRNSGTRFQFIGDSDIASWTSSTWSSVTPWFTITASNAYVNGKDVIHSGNIGSQSVNYASSAGNADTVDSQHFKWSNDSNSPTYLWAANSSGTAFLCARGSMSVNYANSAGSASSCDYANYVYCSSHIGSWRLSSDWDGSYFWLTGKYSGSLPCAVSYASSAGSTSYASSAGYADSCGSFSGAWAIEGGNEVNLIPSSFGYDRLWFNYTAKGGSHVNLNSNYFGNAHTGTVNCYAASFGNSSDIRYKQIIEYLSPSLEQIAYAPIFKFMWTNKYDPELHAGSSAQYWLGVVRELVHYDDYIDQYFLNYGETALISAVTVAKETLNLKNIVLQLQSENEQLKSRISMLESTVRLLTES